MHFSAKKFLGDKGGRNCTQGSLGQVSSSGDPDVILWIILKAVSSIKYIIWMYIDTLSFLFLSCSYATHIWTLWTNLTYTGAWRTVVNKWENCLNKDSKSIKNSESCFRHLIFCILWEERIPEFFSTKDFRDGGLRVFFFEAASLETLGNIHIMVCYFF